MLSMTNWTAHRGDNDFAPLRNIFNEWLVREDTRAENQSSETLKGMSVKAICKQACVLSYLMDEDENFIIDEEAAP